MPVVKKQEELYSDALITIRGNSIVFHDYYFVGVSKAVLFNEIDAVTEYEPDIYNGKWPVWGSGSPGVWFPLDWERPKRDRIFVVRLKNKDSQIGFTVQDPAKVDEILRGAGLVKG
jgi:hypothetical protein